MNLIFFPIALLMCLIFGFSLRLVSKPHKNVLLENTFAPEHLTHPSVTQLVKEYRKRILQLMALFSVASLLFLFNLSDSITITLFFVYLFALIGCCQLLEIHYIGRLRQLIVDQAWLLPIDAVRIDTKIVQEKNRQMLSLGWFLPTLVLMVGSGYQARYSADQATTIGVLLLNGCLLLLFLALWWTIRGLPVRGIAGDSLIDQQINDLTKYYWSLTVVVLATGTSLMLFIPLVSINAHGFWGVFMSMLFILLTIGSILFSFLALLTLRKKQDRLLNQAEKPRYYGEDVYWRYGVYINPNDDRLFVPDRIGLNIGINLGKRSGQMIGIGTLILLIGAMLIAIVPLYQLDFTADPLQGQLVKEEVVFSAPFTTKTTVPVSAIEEVALIDSLPTPIVKKVGMATNEYATGSFSVAGESAKLYVDLQAPTFLRIQTNDQLIYYTNKDPEKTIALYKQLLQRE